MMFRQISHLRCGNGFRNLQISSSTSLCSNARFTASRTSLPISIQPISRRIVNKTPTSIQALNFSTKHCLRSFDPRPGHDFDRVPYTPPPPSPHQSPNEHQNGPPPEDDPSTRKLITAFIVIFSICHVAYYADYSTWIYDAWKLASQMKEKEEFIPSRDIQSRLGAFEKEYAQWVSYRIENQEINPIVLFNSNFANQSLISYIGSVVAFTLLAPPLCRLYGPLKVFAMFAVGGTGGCALHCMKNQFDLVYDKFRILNSMLDEDRLSPLEYKWAVVLLPPSPDLWEGVYSGSSTALVSLATIACFVVPQLRIAVPLYSATTLALRPLVGVGFLHDAYSWEGKRLGGYVSGFLIWILLLRKGRFQKPKGFF